MGGCPLVGRDEELGLLEASLAAASDGVPQLVLIEGEAGVGKTSLLGSFAAGRHGCEVLRWAGDETETQLSFAMVAQLLNETRSWADPFAAGAALLAHVGEATTDGPLVLMLDDLHLADQPSLVALNFALRRLRHDPVLAVLSIRPGQVIDLPSSLVRPPTDGGAHLVLGGLTVPDVQELAETTGAGRLSRRSAERLHAITGGNPLHLKALLHEVPLSEIEQIERPIPAPKSFAQLVLADLAATSSDARQTAMAASVLGDRCELADLARVAGLEVDTALRSVEELVRIRVLRAPAGASAVVFDHPLVRAAVYGDLGPAVRSDLHRTAAASLTGTTSLRHRMAAAIQPDPVLATDLEEWSSREKESGNPVAAAEAMLAAHRMTPVGPDADRRLLATVALYTISGDARAAQTHSGSIAALPVSGRRLAVQARLAWLTGRPDEAMTLGEQAWACNDIDPSERDLVAAMLAQIEVLRDHGQQAVTWAGRALAAEGGLDPGLASHTRAQRALGLATSGRLEEAVASMADLPADPKEVPLARHPELSTRGHLKLWSGPPAAAQADLAVAAALTHGDMQPFRLTAAAALAYSLFTAGEWDQGQATLEQLLPLAEDMGQNWILGYLHAQAAAVPAARGEWTTAEQHVSTALEYAARAGNLASMAYADEAAVLLATARDDPQGVVRATERIHRTPETAPQRDLGLFWWPVHRIVALIDLSCLDEAEAELEVLRRRARPGERRTEAARMRVTGQLAAARHDLGRARECLTSAIDMADDHVDALEQSLALEAFGRFLRRRGERRSAIEHLRHARTRYQGLAAVPFVRRCDRELAACGVNDPDPAASTDPLTPQERAVAALICAGRTNRQAAEELVLSVKTIGYHLANVYTKLGVHSRAQLVSTMSDRGWSPAPSRQDRRGK